MFVLRLSLLAVGYLVSLLIFQRGLLLKRQVLTHQSSCSDVHASTACWIQPEYNRSVWLVIDALRHDFIAPLRYDSEASYFRGQMPLTSWLILNKPENTRLFHFIADAPTTTLQRLKALTTGTLPTFIEAGENFGGSEILEDNVISRLVDRGRNVTFIGDDTWLSLLPKKFHRSYHGPSFDIKDLHTVDNLVLNKIYDELQQKDWSVLIAHTLGVDHCGHRYGPDHAEMSSKLRQMDSLVYNLTQLIDDDTILFVMGDHGMTKTGDHGGDSAMEMDAALFVYSKRLPDYSKINFKFPNALNQIDFVPTLSLLLDVPIPFSNLGKVIPTLFAPEKLSEAMKINSMQIIRFVQTYINQEPSYKDTLEWLIREYESEHEDDYFRHEKVADNVLNVLRGAWTKFDLSMIRIGIFSFCECLLFNLWQVRSAPSNAHFTFGIFIFRSGLMLLQSSLLIGGSSDAVLISTLDLTLSASNFYHLIQMAFHVFTVDVQMSFAWPFLVALIQGLSYTSNSFIIYENDAVRFLMQSGLVAVLFEVLAHPQSRTSKKGTKRFLNLLRNHRDFLIVLGCMMAIRMGKLFERCREEQVDCEETIFAAPLSTLPYDETKIGRFVLGAFAIVAMNVWFNKNTQKSSSTYSATLGLTEAVSWPVTCLVILHWLCDLVPVNYDWLSLRTAQVAYLILIGHLFATTMFSEALLAFKTQFHMWSLVIGMILGDGNALNLLFFIVILDRIGGYIDKIPLKMAIFLIMLGSHGFFSFGHQASIAMIPWHAAFVGIPGNFVLKFVPGLLLFLHLFAGKFLCVYSIFTRDQSCTKETKENDETKSRFQQISLLLLTLSALKVSGICIACVIHRRHLMIFKVFAPKFIYEAIEHAFISIMLLILSTIYGIKNS